MKTIIHYTLTTLLMLLLLQAAVQPQSSGVIVDQKGVLRNKKGKDEIKGFGVNYTLPFAHAWRTAKNGDRP